MNFDEAKHLLLIHGSGTTDADGQPVVLDDGFLASLRPYNGLLEKNFHLVMEALLVVGERIHCSPQVDSDLVESVWSICSVARDWGVHPNGMLQRNKLITIADANRLEVWIGIIERAAQGLLRGRPPHSQVLSYAEYIIDAGWWDNIDFFVPLMDRAISDLDRSDAIEIVVPALAKLGGRAKSVLPTLYDSMTRTYTWYTPEDRCTQETRELISRAIQDIETAG